MQKSILIPTDFSTNAFNAVLYAFELYSKTECTFHIYHTYYISASAIGNPLFPVPDSREYVEAEKQVKAKMNAWKDRVNKIVNPDIHNIHFEYEYGFLVDRLKQKVEEEKIDLIIMGTRGSTDDESVVYGQNTINVMEKVRYCPVLGIPKHVDFKKLNEIVFPTDFKRSWNTKELNVLRYILEITNSEFSILHVGNEFDLDEVQIENKRKLQDLFKSCKPSFHWMQNVTLEDGLLLFVKQRESGMIAFVNRKHRFFSSIFSNPLIIKLGLQTTEPLLALHDNPS